jgi:hypothetical protein
MHEFDCARCGIHVVSFDEMPHPENIYCVHCRFILSIEDPAARQRVAEFMDRKGEPDAPPS